MQEYLVKPSGHQNKLANAELHNHSILTHYVPRTCISYDLKIHPELVLISELEFFDGTNDPSKVIRLFSNFYLYIIGVTLLLMNHLVSGGTWTKQIGNFVDYYNTHSIIMSNNCCHEIIKPIIVNFTIDHRFMENHINLIRGANLY